MSEYKQWIESLQHLKMNFDYGDIRLVRSFVSIKHVIIVFNEREEMLGCLGFEIDKYKGVQFSLDAEHLISISKYFIEIHETYSNLANNKKLAEKLRLTGGNLWK